MFGNLFDKVLVDDWRSAWKFYSLWIYLVIGMLPQLLELASSFGLAPSASIPGFFSDLLKWVAFLGAASRLIKQVGAVQGLPSDPSKRSV